MELEPLIRSGKTLIVLGGGGVGKTTVAASLALQAAMGGARALVLTVDPARRLATSLGLESFEEEHRRVAPGPLERVGLEMPGELHAAMLDTKSTFDRVVGTYAPSPEVRDRILSNRFYRSASGTLAGSQEYMAMEKLYEVRSDAATAYELIVLDTPPSRHALDFLTAPSRMLNLMESDTFRALLASLKAVGWRARSGRMSRLVFSGIGRFVGGDVFLGILEFFESFSSMYDGFSERSRLVERLLRSDEVSFLVVTSPTPDSVDEAIFLRERLAAEGMPFGGFVVNRAHRPFVPGEPDCETVSRALVEAMRAEPALGLYDPDIVGRAAHNVCQRFEEMQRLVRRDGRSIAKLRQAAGGDPVLVAPHFPEDIHDLEGLYRFASRVVRDASSACVTPDGSDPGS